MPALATHLAQTIAASEAKSVGIFPPFLDKEAAQRSA